MSEYDKTMNEQTKQKNYYGDNIKLFLYFCIEIKQ